MSFFTEATRVQMPAMVHLTRLGYTYFGKISKESEGEVYDGDTNILLQVFKEQFAKLNPSREGEYLQVLQDIKMKLDDDDLGHGFYNMLKSVSPVRLIDFENPKNNAFHFTAEFTCKNGQDEFRPDITLFVNGLPLCFVEVKKPNNQGGMVAESKRMNNLRFPNKKFRRFINITQLMIFSNNMEYDTLDGIVPVEGAFYCTGARSSAPFNCFREENYTIDKIAPYHKNFPYLEVDKNVEWKILSDFNCQIIHKSPEYLTNCDINKPTNRILTSMCSPERLLYIIRYGIAYVRMEREVDGEIVSTDEKHIMRYQQLFASQAIVNKLQSGVKSGIVWHTQGSGKTALSFFLTHILTDFYAKQNIVAKFYFIVDRLDLLEQASQEFEARGLMVQTANSREELMEQFRTNQALEGATGQTEITVVNIQKFKEDSRKVNINTYATNLQRVFILDEAHRGYRPGGCFLANLFEADPNSIKIALTGTPLIGEERASCDVFGNYLHTYYYDRSIADGYTLKIIREDILTTYKKVLSDTYDEIEAKVEKAEVSMHDIIEHPQYVKQLAAYIQKDLKDFRVKHGDESLGGMVICETSEQARQMYKVFEEAYHNPKTKNISITLRDGTFVMGEYNVEDEDNKPLKAGLILYDSDDKETLKQIVKDFKKNMTIDILIVYNMLLTGFDAPRLKRLYFGRKIKDHNLLQAITRVNRPYKGMRYGYLIDFADIKKNFDETNEAYLRELNRYNNADEVGEDNATDTFVQVIESPEEIEHQMQEIKETLFSYTYDNAEEFSNEISAIDTKEPLFKLRHALDDAKNISNIVRTFGDDEMKEKFSHIEIAKVPELLKEVERRIKMINQKEAFSMSEETKVLINEAMMDIEFNFTSLGTEELNIISGGEELKEKYRHTIGLFTNNYDHDDPEYISLQDMFVELFKKHGFKPQDIDEYNEESAALDDIIRHLSELQRKNDSLLKKYNDDHKFARIHKRICEENERRKANNQAPLISAYEEELRIVLNLIKEEVDQQVYNRSDILNHDEFFAGVVMSVVSRHLYNIAQLNAEMEDFEYVGDKITRQYLNQYRNNYVNA